MEERPLSRESILDGHVEEIAAFRAHALPVMSQAEREALIVDVLSDVAATDPVHVFAYGSLIWNPAMHVSRSFTGRLDGYQRRFCFWTIMGRGCEENPGLMLGLEPGGNCDGLVYEIAPDLVSSEIDVLFRREMISYAYTPCWVDVEHDEGRVRCLTFAMNLDSDRYCGELDPATRIRHIATAKGYLGRNCDYLFDLVEHLDGLGLDDEYMRRLAESVRDYQVENPHE